MPWRHPASASSCSSSPRCRLSGRPVHLCAPSRWCAMGSDARQPRVPTSKTQFVYEWLKEEILSGALSAGARIRQQDVAEALGVSYTPVREAIRQLQATGLITYEPNRGNAVSSLNDDGLRELYLL